MAGKRVCLRVGQRCNPGLRPAYLKARLECRARRLRRASLQALRRGEAVLVNRNGRIDPRNALEAFDAKIAPLPGITPRRGAVGDLHDATSVILAVARQSSRLTLAQRAVLDRVLTSNPQATAAAVTPAEQTLWNGLLIEAKRRLADHGYPIPHAISLSFPDSEIDPDSGQTVQGYAWPSWLDDSKGTPGTCSVWITPLARRKPLSEQRNTMAHELFHCAQFEHYDSIDDDARVPQWAVEGGAEWAGTTIEQEWSGTAGDDKFWYGWLQQPETDLGVRKYSAIGFFALLPQHWIDVFARMHGVLRAGADAGDRAAYAVATAGVPPAFFDTWGGGLLRQPGLGAEWDYRGPGLPSTGTPVAAVNNGTSLTRSTDERGAKGLRLTLNADVVELTAIARQGIMREPDGQKPLKSETYCTKPGGCSCEGEPIEAKRFPRGGALPVGWVDGYIKVEGRRECEERRATTGIMLFRQGGGGAEQAANFVSGSCRIDRNGVFHATSRSAGYTLEVRISRFRLRTYRLRFRDADPGFRVQGPGGPYSNLYFPPRGTPPPSGGAITFPNGRERMGLGFVNAFNANNSAAILLAGQMTCRWPRR